MIAVVVFCRCWRRSSRGGEGRRESTPESQQALQVSAALRRAKQPLEPTALRRAKQTLEASDATLCSLLQALQLPPSLSGCALQSGKKVARGPTGALCSLLQALQLPPSLSGCALQSGK